MVKARMSRATLCGLWSCPKSRFLRLLQVDDPPEPVYANVERQPRATSPRSAAAPPRLSPVWETHTDAGTGRPYYYNPDTGVTTWESPFETPEGATSPATSRASVGSGESLETEWGQYWDEESRRVFFYNPLTGETAWEDETEELEEDHQEQLEMQPSLSPRSPEQQRVRGRGYPKDR